MESENNLSENDIRSTIQRSAAYPSITIERAIEFVNQLKKSFPNTVFNRDDIAAVLQKKSNLNREVGASVQYGLLDRTIGEGYKLSNRAKAILNPVSEEERIESIIECFKHPKLYLEIFEKYKNHVLPADPQLRAILNRFHNITEAAAPQAAEVFIENATYAGLLNGNRILSEIKQQVVPKVKIDVEYQDATPIANPTERQSEPIIHSPQPTTTMQQNPLLLEEINGSVNIKIRLSEKKIAHLIYPENINEKDIQIMKLQIDLLALTI